MNGNGHFQYLGLIFFSLTELYDFALGLGGGFADLGGCERLIKWGCVRCVMSSWGAENTSEGGKPEEWFWVLV